MKAEHKAKLELLRQNRSKTFASRQEVIDIPAMDEVVELQAALEEGLTENFDNIDKQLAEIKHNKTDFKPVLESLEQLEKAVTENAAIVRAMGEFTEAVKGIKPVVKVDAPKQQAAPVKSTNPYDTYKPADSYEAKAGNQYYGFLDTEGKWFIMRVGGKENKQYRYATGDTKYTEAWRKRSSHDYKRYNEARF